MKTYAFVKKYVPIGSVIMAKVKDMSLKITELGKSGTLGGNETVFFFLKRERGLSCSGLWWSFTYVGTAGEMLDGPGVLVTSLSRGVFEDGARRVVMVVCVWVLGLLVLVLGYVLGFW